MGKLLSEDAIRSYHDNGYLFPIRVLSEQEALGYRRRLEAAERQGHPRTAQFLRTKSHLVYTFCDELIRHPRILDAVEDVIGPDILCWSSGFFNKEAKDPAYVSWHQDLTYWGLDPADIVTAWVALSPATIESGCMKFLPGSHKSEVLPHQDTFAPENLLSRGQEVQVEVDESKVVFDVLAPGEMSLHHVKLIHGSEANRSDDRRIGFVIRYIPTYVRQVVGRTDSATLVRGTDRYGHFEPEERPAADLDPAAIAHYDEVMDRLNRVLYRGTEKAKEQAAAM
ncbi:MAG: phytanoyl-CoA dioxygenase family protein [Geminicoccaceae bacterium]|nr:phytanoyl-CoA dioxygenase family protein [Geminicoccaceae bacterium]MCX8101162.1 phytanoyl-CoA dioxygenase family protein [Geminicoccaceae bacterium]